MLMSLGLDEDTVMFFIQRPDAFDYYIRALRVTIEQLQRTSVEDC